MSSSSPDIAPTHAPRRSPWPLLVFMGLFLASVGGAWAWFNTGPKLPPSGHRLTARSQVPGQAFKPEPLSDEVLTILATTNVFNGAFAGAGGPAIKVFLADWSAAPGQRLTDVHHTPDNCWVAVGWKPVDLGQPTQFSLNVGGVELPFECRVFEAPRGEARELVVWCTLVGGQVLPESTLFHGGARSARDYREERGRLLVAAQFWQMVKRRLPPQGFKQFVRYSVPLTGEWPTALERVRNFGPQWLEVQPLTDRPTAGQ